MIVVDSHLDLAWNALGWNRDLNLTVREIRDAEKDMTEANRGTNTVALPEMRKGRVALSLATILVRVGSVRAGKLEDSSVAAALAGDSKLDYRNDEIAYAVAQGQLAYYRILESHGQLRMIRDRPSLEDHFRHWEGAGSTLPPLGFILSMEGADPIVSPRQLGHWWNDGLRVVGLAHYGAGRYAHGTGSSGGLTGPGIELLKAMEDVGVILDVTHLADESFWQAVERFHGPVLASHNNCRSLVPGPRQFTDEQIQCLIGRDAVIGAACDTWMLSPGWEIGKTSNPQVTLDAVVDHIDHVCQLAGNARHAAIGSDLDGGFGTEQSPCDLDTIADLQKLSGLLRKRGYQEVDIEAIMHGNWFRFFQAAWTH